MAYYDSTGYDTGYSRGGGGGGDYNAYGGGGGGGGGGGFLPSTDISSSQPAASSSASLRGKRDPQSLLPLTIKQLHHAVYAHDKFVIDGRDVMQVTLVCQVRAIQPMATNVQYTLNDGTGEIVCRVYMSEDGSGGVRGDAAVNGYVRVIGVLKMMPAGERGVQGYHVIPIADCNEITYHQIEAVYTHLKQTGGGQAAGAGQAAGMKGDAAMSSSQSYSMQPGGGGPAAGVGGPTVLEPHLSAQHNAVLAVFYHNSSEQGASVSEVSAVTGLSATAIHKIVKDLSDDGHLYSTVDEEHYKSTRE